MFNKKLKREIEIHWNIIKMRGDRLGILEKEIKQLKGTRVESVECKTCGCLIKKEDRFAVEVAQDGFAAEINVNCVSYGNYNWTYAPDLDKEYYCLIHKPPYDRVVGDKYYKDNVEVDEKGQLLNKKKK